MQRTKRIWLVLPILLAVLVWTSGCASWRSDPLVKGWHGLGFDPNSVNKEIQDDYRAFIQKQKDVYIDSTDVTFFDDGTGQHAVSIRMWSKENPTAWFYTLIYDKGDKRIKTIKWGYGGYQS